MQAEVPAILGPLLGTRFVALVDRVAQAVGKLAPGASRGDRNALPVRARLWEIERMARRRLPQVLTVVALSSASCSAPTTPPEDAGIVDAGGFDGGTVDAGGVDAGGIDAGGVDAGGVDAGLRDGGTDGGCLLPSDFPPDASNYEISAVCNCVESSFSRCHEEGGPRCSSWGCYPGKSPDGGYVYMFYPARYADGGYVRTADGGYDYSVDAGISCVC